jgi:D-3-phosphoglycerate dehydrogenase / 2-oxoglutarate reductase
VAKVVLVSLAEDENVLPRFRAALAGDGPDADFAHTVPAGPGIAGLAVAPPVRVTAGHVAALPDLRVVAAASAGYDHIDVAAVTAAGGCVTNAPGYCDIEVADHAIAMAGALLRRLHAADAMVRGGVWSSRAVGARRITGSTIGVVGLGRIGTLTAQRAAGLGMRVLAWAPHTPPARVRALGALPCQALPALLAASDVVSLHLPLTPETKGIIDAGALAAMRPGSYLVNCGRGELADLDALRDALGSGHLAGAALDVLDTEPPPAGHVAFDLPNTILTPHLAWLSPESEFASYEMAARAIADVLAGRPPRHPVRP